jgi:hypothetical protein
MGIGYEELRRLISESERADWNVVSCFGAPSFLPWSPEGEFSEHLARASYRPDISIGLAWGIRDNDDYKEDWANSFANEHAESFLADILFNGMLVGREYLVCVDGGRTYLPRPYDLEQLLVRRWDHDFARLLDTLQYTSGVGGGLGDFDPSRFAPGFSSRWSETRRVSHGIYSCGARIFTSRP